MDATQKKIFKFLFRESDHIALQALSEVSRKDKAYIEIIPLSNLLQIDPETVLKIWNPPHDRYGMYFCPNPIRPGRVRNQKSLVGISCVFVDMDKGGLNQLKKLPLPPHIICQRTTNSDKLHAYFKIEFVEATEENIKKYKNILRYFIDNLQADPQVTNPAMLLRIPYTRHTKPDGTGGHYQVVSFPSRSRKSYTLDELHKQYSSPLEKGKSKKDKKTKPKPGSGNSDHLSPDAIVSFLQSQYAKAGPRRKGGGRSRFLFHAGLDFHRWGISEDDAQAYAIKLNSRFCSPEETSDVVSHQIASAYRYSTEEFGAYLKQANDKETEEVLESYRNSIRIRHILRDWVFVSSVDRFINLETGMELTTLSQIDNHIAYMCATDMRFRSVLRKQLVRVVDVIDFIPENNRRILKMKEKRILNRFVPLALGDKRPDKLDENAVKIFDDHMRYLTTTDYEYDAVMNFFAYLIQNPGAKLPYALLMISRSHGIGKSLLELLFRNMLKAKNGISYVSSLENKQLTSNYTHFFADTFLCFVHELEQSEKYHMMNQLRSLITESTIEINGKWMKPYNIRNTVNLVLLSNYAGPVRVDKFDRRLLVIYNDRAPQFQDYYKLLAKTFTEEYESIYWYLRDRDLSGFDPHKRPEMTAGKAQLIELGSSELEIYLDEIRENKEGPFSRPLLNATTIQDYASLMGPGILRGRVSTKAVRSYLLSRDYLPEKMFVRHNQKPYNRTYWHTPDVTVTPEMVKTEIDCEISELTE